MRVQRVVRTVRGWKKRIALWVAVGASLLGMSAEVSSAALAKASGGSGYSGALSANRTIRRQQLICDPSSPGAASDGSASGAPLGGSTSVSYDPSLVTISAFQFGPGYTGQAFVELREPAIGTERAGASPAPGQVFFETIANYLGDRSTEPGEVETGYIQVFYTRSGTAGQMSPDRGFAPIDSAGVNGVDTHSLTFTYLDTTPDTTVSKYTIFADPGGRPSGNKTDTMTGVGADGKTFSLGPSQLSSATVSGSLVVATVPLPPAVWSGLAMLATVMVAVGARKVVRA